MAKASSRLKSERKIPKIRIARPSGRPFQLRYLCPRTKSEVRISVGSRDEADAEKLKAEIGAKLLLGIEPRPERVKLITGPEMLWQDFREQFRTLHLSTVRGSTATHAESRLDLAERILNPTRLRDIADSNALLQLQKELLSGAQSRRKKPRSAHTVRGYMNSILAALNWAYHQDWLHEAPKLRKIKTSKQKTMKGRPFHSLRQRC